MGSGRFTFFVVAIVLFVLAAFSSCQKDPAVAAPGESKSVVADSSVFSSPGNSLAAFGTLKIKFGDSTYTFDATRDSIAFINVSVDNTSHYFGITAINKEHTMSFGISSAGFAYSNIFRAIAGSQFLVSGDDRKPALQLSLSRYSGPKDFGDINVSQYNVGNQLAKGSFYTFLAKDDKAGSPYYRVEGTFDLRLK